MYFQGRSPREYIKLHEGYKPYTLESPSHVTQAFSPQRLSLAVLMRGKAW